MSYPTLSVIMPNYNQGQYIGETLESVLSQSFLPFEIILIDDCSSDNSMIIIEKHVKENPIIRLIRHEQNQGVEFTVKQALNISSGTYIYILSPDDKVSPGFFEKSMGLLAQFPQAGLCCSNPIFFDDQTNKVKINSLGWSDTPRYFTPVELIDIINGGFIAGHTSIMKRSALLESGGYISELKWHCDWFALLVIGFRFGICYTPDTLASLRVVNNSFSSSGRRDWSQQKKVLQHLLNLLKSPEYQDMATYFARGRVMSIFGDEIIRVAMGNPENINKETLMLISCCFHINPEIT